jgi:hypothetical protein
MYDSAKAAVFLSAAQTKRSKTVGGLAVVAGLVAGVVGLVNVLAGNRDIVDTLLLVGGVLVSAAGLRLLRRGRALHGRAHGEQGMEPPEPPKLHAADADD